ncbi:MAG TPA: pyridoxamine 5'-phosphate oxidase [Methylococcaceae bacterium]|nr:pyridoxamine 5'-phosphate oxidase [Methylococcaceae bacterium]
MQEKLTQEPRQTPALAEILAEARGFHRAFQSVLMATAANDGRPHASYAPYIEDDEGCFHVFLSELAAHTRNLLQDRRVSLLFIEEESVMKQVFARKRVTYEGSAREISRDDPAFAPLLDQMAERHGPIVGMLRNLRDFHLFKVTPDKAIYVRGFGEAFTLEGADLQGIRWMGDRGHQSLDEPL